jgi:hypothetical protein
MDWSRWAQAYPDAAGSPLLRELTGARPRGAPSRQVPTDGGRAGPVRPDRPGRDRLGPWKRREVGADIGET